jgi:uncharacterized DUF497 family protein
MRFEWDEDRNLRNISKHGLDFIDAEQLLAGLILVAPDIREYGEDPWIGIGFIGERVVVIVYSEAGEDVIRVISLQKATSHDRKRFETFLKDRLEPG